MEKIFVDQFEKYVKTHKSLRKAYRSIRKDFTNNIVCKQPMTTNIIQILEEHSKNVAWIEVMANDQRVNMGTFFLLTESLGLTCYHLVKDVLKTNFSISITFDYTAEDVDVHYLPAEVETYSEQYDYAYLRVKSPSPEGPVGLLQNLSIPPQDGVVAIIGHLQGDCKKIDFSSVVNFDTYEDLSPPSFVHVLTMYNYMKMLQCKLTSSKTSACLCGAPIFNERGELVGMHKGCYRIDAPNKSKTMIEYGRSIVEIIVIGSIKIVELRHQFFKLLQRNKTLESYLDSASHPPHMKTHITNLKKLWEEEIRQISMETKDQKLLCAKQMEVLKITQTLRARGYTNKGEIEEDGGTRPPLTFEVILSLQFEIADEDALYRAFTCCSHYISQKAFTFEALLSPGFFYNKTEKASPGEEAGCYKCKPECKACKYMKEDTIVSSYRTEKKYEISQRIGCNSSYVVYLISCTSCRLQYVGCTIGKLKGRIFKHISDASNKLARSPSAVSKHFFEVHEGNLCTLEFRGILIVEEPSRRETRQQLLRNQEAFWIWNLNTIHPNGLNRKLNFAYRPLDHLLYKGSTG
ncbi:uncharacterized protein [Eleutherodactylus coqui]|uniref:uncharacterized protein n=1 Tax=Eleutherodactylus coqui TaxID=57060 RepID=UPI003461B7DE